MNGTTPSGMKRAVTGLVIEPLAAGRIGRTVLKNVVL
jgi:hypothetical protein